MCSACPHRLHGAVSQLGGDPRAARVVSARGPRVARSARRVLAMIDREERHSNAVANTLRWADQAALDGDYSGALAWLAAIEAIGDELPAGYQTKRHSWRTAQNGQVGDPT